MLGSLLGNPTKFCLKKATCCWRFVSDNSLPILMTEGRHEELAFWNNSGLSSMKVSGPPFVTIFLKKIGVVLSNDLEKNTHNNCLVTTYHTEYDKNHVHYWLHVLLLLLLLNLSWRDIVEKTRLTSLLLLHQFLSTTRTRTNEETKKNDSYSVHGIHSPDRQNLLHSLYLPDHCHLRKPSVTSISVRLLA